MTKIPANWLTGGAQRLVHPSNKTYTRFVAVALVCQTSLAPCPVAAQEQSDIDALVGGNSTFALELFSALSPAPGNLFFSPYSISAALAMAYLGARGETEAQMAEVLHFGANQGAFHSTFAHLNTAANAVERTDDIEFALANGVWVQDGVLLGPDFRVALDQYYSAQPMRADFSRNADAARAAINAWIGERTRRKIKEFIPPGALSTATRLMLANAIYFKGKWARQFNERDTTTEEFWLTPASAVRIRMMSRTDKFQLMENQSWQLLRLPYVGDRLSMLVLLPRERNGLDALQHTLSADDLRAWSSALEQDQVRVFLPIFTVNSQLDLANTLASMGLSNAFGQNADFSGMDDGGSLFISAIRHEAIIEVNEQGTEAVAATGVQLGIRSGVTPRIFRADHPFVFLIRDDQSGSILFMGRVSNPATETKEGAAG